MKFTIIRITLLISAQSSKEKQCHHDFNWSKIGQNFMSRDKAISSKNNPTAWKLKGCGLREVCILVIQTSHTEGNRAKGGPFDSPWAFDVHRDIKDHYWEAQEVTLQQQQISGNCWILGEPEQTLDSKSAQVLGRRHLMSSRQPLQAK